MSTQQPEGPPTVINLDQQTVERDRAADLGGAAPTNGEVEATETVEQPAKVLRIGTMIRQLLEEVRQAPLDDASRGRMKEIYETSVHELAAGLSPDLSAELERLTSPFAEGTPSESELRIAQAQLVGWLEGLFHGIQATLFAQQATARSQLDEMRRRGLPRPGEGQQERPGQYL
jgi:hypothetical protein